MKILPKKVIGIDFHDHMIQLVELKEPNGDTWLEAYNRLPIPEGIIKDGIIEKEESFKIIISDLFRKANPRPVEPKNVTVLLPSKVTFTHIFSFPGKLSEKEVIKAIQYEAEMVIPFPIYDLYWDAIILEKNGDQYQYALFAAIQKKIADKYTQTFEEAGITPVLFGVHVEALKYALERELPKEEFSLIIDLGALSTNYLTIRGKTIKHYLSSNEGTSELIQNISKKFPIYSSESLFENWEKYKDDPKFKEIISKFIKDKYKTAADIISKRQIKDNTDGIKNIFLTGEYSNLPGFYELAQKQFANIKISIGDPKKSLKVKDANFIKQSTKEEIKPHYSIYFTDVIGTALSRLKAKEEGNINLIPTWLKRNFLSKKIEIGITIGAIFMSIISLIIAGFVSIMHQQLSYERTNLEIAKSSIELILYGTRYQEIKDELKAFNQEITILSNIDNGLFSIQTVLTDILATMPTSVTITSIGFDDTNLTFAISGIAENRDVLLDMQDAFQDLPFISNIDIPLSSYDKKEQVPFQINLTLIFSELPEYDPK
ncbi:MAG: hypothetical protein UV80_C0002G0301 [Candidatus Peregrinibacteria bacterium GW2011_GWF2_43_17]|nr:MAG: hypothetical protein UV80_C0002G0301 [Candidatus Peregrinibacteria bacterium GW2011_GWF2_43_17]KKT20422.1 MAG: hypothetical protein UW03_C0004G0006 [Candidatus Peregrinibacteria bacterium GW2011_GWA2_43_8]HAU39657.1 hypothetical protein [Candidatus Peregrinibacteria bacterium]